MESTEEITPVSTPGAAPLRQSLPIILPSFVNKCGDIGMRLFPMLLVEQRLDTGEASLIMALVKGTTLISAVAGGLLGDRIGHKRTILLSLVISGAALGALPLASGPFWLCVVGMVAMLGQGLFPAPLRLLLVQTVPAGSHKVALAWLRTAHNGAVMTANAVAYFTSGIGLAALFLFDCATSLVAAALGSRILPEAAPTPRVVRSPAAGPRPRILSLGLVLTTLLISGFTLLMELFFVCAAAQAKIAFGARGVEVFAQVMMINTFLCMAFNVLISKLMRSELVSFVVGIALQGGALILFLANREEISLLFLAVLFQSLGELVFTSMSQLTLLRLVPSQGRQGGVYGSAITIQLLGKTAGAALAFPVLSSGIPALVGVAVFSVALLGMTVPLVRAIRVKAL